LLCPHVTTAQLLTWILAALLLQFAAGIGIALWRRQGAIAVAPSIDEPLLAAQGTAAWQGTRDFRVKARAFEDAAQSQCSFYLEPLDGAALPDFSPGQFLTFSLPVPDPSASGENRTVTRCYSLSDRPSPLHYRITVKRVPPPADRPELPPGVSSSHFHDRVQPGDVLKVKAPSGHFVIDPEPAVPAVLVAGGIGITPMMSMLTWCLAEQPQRTVHLYYGVRNGSEHAFKAQLEAMAAAQPRFRLHVVYSRPGEGDRQGIDFQDTGYVDVGLLRRMLPHGRHQFYVCGPTAMLEALVPALAEWGVPQQDIHYEAFGPASVRSSGARPVPAAAASAPVEVRFHRSGRTLAWEGQDANLLDFAERHGIAVDSGCRTGGCGSCETRLVSGTVVYDHRPDHDVAPGHCLLCVGRPDSALVLEA
jgi:ferredoxin-NADP reductase